MRKLRRAPLFSTVAILTLAVGIGANSAIFTVVNSVLLEPLPFEDPDGLVGVWHAAPGLGFENLNQSPALHFTYVEEGRAFESVGAWSSSQVSVTGLAEPEQIDAAYVTHQTLPLLRARPMIGRVFTAEEDVPGGAMTALVSHGYWTRRFGADPGVVGQTVQVNGVTREIVGVLPEGFDFMGRDADLFLPFQWDRSELFVGNFSYFGVARLAPGATVAEANADIERMIPMAFEKFPGGLTMGMAREAGFGPRVRSLKEDVVGDVGSVLWVLLGTVAIVLLIACANVANLFIVRAEGRQRELAVRTAMGAGRAHITSQLLTESLVLGIAGGLVGLGLAYVGLEYLVALGPESLPRLAEIAIDGKALAFTAGVSLAASVLFGLFPAIRYGAPNLVVALKEGGRGGSAGKERHLARNGLVVAQMALALVLLAGSGLMVRSFQALRAVDPGFEDPDEVLTFRVTIPNAEIEDPAQVGRTHREILSRIQAIPGVASAALTSSATMDGWNSNDAVDVEDFPVEGDQIPGIRRFKWIDEGYHATMGNPVLAGRSITTADSEDLALVAVITENMARELWGSPQAAIGKRIRQFVPPGLAGEMPVPWREIVGVVGDIHDEGAAEEAVATVFWPQTVGPFWDQEVMSQRSMVYVIRVRSGDPRAVLDPAREAVWAVNPNLPLARVRTLGEIADGSMARTSFTLVMLGIAAGVALFLGLVGIYGVISYVVAQRTREIGVRIAMGAEQVDVRTMVLKQAMVLAAGGVTLGLAGAAGLTRLMSSLLFGVSPTDPVTLGAVSALIAAIALVASWLPARRASKVDPVTALRFE